ncbi:MAG: PEPxxWA-CTERM sorting domain-containing protein [Methylotenera sp.]|nr:PEPxxWA-CTERM sorting domain-containing protein [Methylotenera sp.]
MSRPDLTNGCYLPHACWMDTPLSRRDVLGVDTLRVIGTVNSIHPAFLDFYIYDLVRHDVLDYRAFDAMTWAVWSPSTVAAIPEPSTYAMMLAGFGLMGFMIRRRKTNEQA